MARVQIVDALDQTIKPLGGFLNPNSISYAFDVEIGELNPVGMSGSVLQYGFTKSGRVPLELYFSTQLSPRIGASFEDLTYYTDWFMSYGYGDEIGTAPRPLLIIWPRVMELVLVVASYKADFVRFHGKTLMPAAIRVSIETRELRLLPRTAEVVKTDGILDGSLGSGAANTGQPTKLKAG